MVILFANGGDPDQNLHSVMFGLGLHSLLFTFLGSPDGSGLEK